jgi:hypothetical protein
MRRAVAADLKVPIRYTARARPSAILTGARNVMTTMPSLRRSMLDTAALQRARELGSGRTVVTVAVDTGNKYLAGDLYR